jgi:hypothetical protein
VDVFSALGQDAYPVMTIQNRSIRPDFQRALLARSKGGFQLTRRPTAKLLELGSTQSDFGMQKFELW